MRKQEIHAIYEDDLDAFLEKLGLLEAFKNGELQCAICSDKITKSNFRFVYPEENDIKICCSKLDCYEKVISKIK